MGLMRNRKIAAGTTLAVALCLGNSVFAQTVPSNILFVLDGSGSMWGQIGGVAKIQTAKDTMTKLMDDLPPQTNVGLMTYGTRSKQSCEDVVELNAVGASRDAIKANIARVQPLGKTPIAYALRAGISKLAVQAAGQHKSMVLISDGIETCQGDPCSIAKMGKMPAVDIKVHVVGYDVDDDARKQLQCIANASGGQYFDASDTGGFQDAIEQVVEVAQAKPEPAPAPEPEVEEPSGPTVTEFFRDDFEGSELAEHWAVENANPDNFIVEGGVLTMLSTAAGGFEAEEPQNLMTYTGEMPPGDWDAIIRFTGELSAGGNRISFGLRKDDKNFLASSYVATKTSICHSSSALNTKMSNGQPESVSAKFRGTPASVGNCYTRFALGNEPWESIIADHVEKPAELTFSKRGRNYTVSMMMEGVLLEDGTPLRIETTQFTSLRSPGTLSFTVDRPAKYKGEVLVNIDSVVINRVEE